MGLRFGHLAGGVQDAIPHAMDLLLFTLEFRATRTTILDKCLLHVYASLGVAVRKLAIDHRLCLMTVIDHAMEIHMLARFGDDSNESSRVFFFFLVVSVQVLLIHARSVSSELSYVAWAPW